MKILAIRGENIASLAAPFELDFENGALAHTGLFAITGPTGSGKSTLLDAMCLALFNKTPRLKNHGGAKIGYASADENDRVAETSVQGILTRGAGSGYAEVDFRGVDGKRYRSRWSLARARGRANGRLGQAKVALLELASGQQLGGTKGETLTAIEQRLGLNFEQFGRSVLLAQGEFAAFLKAKDSERGALLEQMTGGFIYAKISRATYQRASSESSKLAELEKELEFVEVLSGEERRALEKRLLDLAKNKQAADELVKSLEAEVAWYQRGQSLQASVERAEAGLHAKLSTWALHEAEGWQVPDIKDGKSVAAFVEENRPQVREAIKLDALLGEAKKKAADAVEAFADLEDEVEEQEETVAAAQNQLAKTKEQHAELIQWQLQHASFGPLAENWALHKSDVLTYERASLEQAELQQVGEKLKVELPQAEQQHTQLKQAWLDAKQQWTKAQKKASAALVAVDEISIGAIQQEQKKALASKEALRKYSELIANSRRHSAELSKQAAVKKASAQAVVAATAELAAVSAKLEQAREDLQRAQLTLDLGDHRAALVEGEACPLCGAQEHPYAQEHPAVARILKEQAKVVEQLENQKSEWVANQAASEQEQQAAELAWAVAAQDLESVADQAEEARKRWQAECINGAGDLPQLSEADAADVLKEMQEDVGVKLAAAEKQLSVYAQLANQLTQARAGADSCQRRLEESKKQLDLAEKAWADLQVQVAQVAQEMQSKQQQAEKVLAALEDVFVDSSWRKSLQHDARGFLQLQQEHVRSWQECCAKKLECEKREPAEEKNCELQQQRLEKLNKELRAAEAAVKERQLEQESLEAARQKVFGGVPADEVSSVLEAINNLATQRQERCMLLVEHVKKGPPQHAQEDLSELLETQRSKQKKLHEEFVGEKVVLAEDDRNLKKRQTLGPAMETQKAVSKCWQDLSGLIGASNGAKFRDYAQGLTLRIVLMYANEKLRELRPRYQLMAVPDYNLDIQIIDHDMADEVRAVSSLSGGESFLVSLALALGLAESTGSSTAVESLFIDEGFGSLDSETLEVAIATLDSLQASGRTVGIISHVDGLADRLGVQVRISKVGGGQSIVEVQSAVLADAASG